MKKNNQFLGVVILLLVVLLPSCSVPLTCELYNNSGASIKIIRIVDGKKIETVINNGSSQVIKEWEYASYKIQIGERWYNFQPSTYSASEEEFVIYKGTLFWGKRIIMVQVEPNMKLYILSKDDEFPLKNTSNQPSGFPISFKIAPSKRPI